MTLWALRRVALLVVALLVASPLVFGLTHLLPGDLAQAAAGVNATPKTVARLRTELGTDRPMLVQYQDWLLGALRGDLGVSPLSGASVGGELREKLAVSAPLVLASSALA